MYENRFKQNQLTAIIGGLPEFTGRFKRWYAEMEGLSIQLTERLRELKEQDGRANDGGLYQEGVIDPVQLAY